MQTRAPEIQSASYSFKAIGTTVVLKVADRRALETARAIAELQIDALDRTCSRFREDSDLMRVNRSAGRSTVVDPLLIEALELALQAAELTDGVVDPTIGRAMILAGYDRDWQLLERPQAHVRYPQTAFPKALHVSAQSGWRVVELDREHSSVRVPAGILLDLGATAKAWAADRCVEAIHETTGVGALIGIGGDISVAGPPPDGGWRVHVTDDHRDDCRAPGQTVRITCGGLATSSVAVRRWIKDATVMHHVIDPSTGRPARSRWRTVSVAAASCAEANIASTATLARASGGHRWLSVSGLPARLVSHAGSVLTSGGWPVD